MRDDAQKPKRPVVGRKGMPVVIDGFTYKSIAQAARWLGTHKAVINRMLRDGEASKA